MASQFTSLAHQPEYTFDYTKADDEDGLDNVLWSQFSCRCGKCHINSGKTFMERLPVLILDAISREERMRIDVELAYVCEDAAYKTHFLPAKDSHRVGLGVTVRCTTLKKRMQIIRQLIYRGVSRIALYDKSIYFDCDDLKPMAFYKR